MQHFIELNGSETKIITDKFIGQKNVKYTLKCGKCGKIFTRTYEDIMYRKRFYCHKCTTEINPKKYIYKLHIKFTFFVQKQIKKYFIC